MNQTAHKSPAEHSVEVSGCAAADDMRFRQLLGAPAWAQLPAAVRRRFGKRLGPGQSVTYAGHVLACQATFSGWLLAQCCRLIGAPLPLERGAGGAAVVSVTEDGVSGGQHWTRIYARRRGFPQAIHSAKRFAGPTGLEEYLGAGFGIALRVEPLADGVRFASDHYFWAFAGIRLRLPRWLAPGRLTIDHCAVGDNAFTFTLTLRHRVLGQVLRQHSLFQDQTVPTEEPRHD